MATPQDTFERSVHLAKQLRGFGLDARPYERAPLEPEIFAVAIERRQITPSELAAIRRARQRGARAIFGPLEPGSSHRASVVLIEGQRFAIGKIVDNRVWHHKPLLLEDWHRVVRNTELDTPGGSHQRRRIMWD